MAFSPPARVQAQSALVRCGWRCDTCPPWPEPHLLVSFAPYTPLLAPLKGIGQLFPGPRKTTRTNTLREDGIVAAAEAAGFVLRRRSLNKAPFYFSRLLSFEKR